MRIDTKATIAIVAALMGFSTLPLHAVETISLAASPPISGDVSIINFSDGTSSGLGDFVQDTSASVSNTINIEAVSAAGFVFDRWNPIPASDSVIITPANENTANITFTADGADHSIQALFKPAPGSVIVNADGTPPNGSVLIENLTEGLIFGPSNSVQLIDVDIGDTVRVTAFPSNGFLFSQWTGLTPFAGEPNPAIFNGDGNDYSFTAVFVLIPPNQVQYNIISMNSLGETVGSPQPHVGLALVDEDSFQAANVTSPHPDPTEPEGKRSVATGWTASGSAPPAGTGDTVPQFQITGDTVITWNWDIQYGLTITVEGDGTAVATPGPIDENWYASGQIVTLQAFPGAEEEFQFWGGDISSLQPTATVVMTSSKDVTAVFGAPLDRDGDGMPDNWEDLHGLDPLDATGLEGAFGDPDCDLLPNIQEFLVSLNVSNALFEISPVNADSDGDGLDDGYEALFLGSATNAGLINSIAPVVATGVNGPDGNPDADFLWNTLTGYETEIGLRNIQEYTGPDGISPTIYVPNFNPGLNSGQLVTKLQPNPDDTGDQSLSNTTDSEIGGAGGVEGDGFDDGFEYSWDVWQGIHGGDPIGDPVNRRVPDRFGDPALPVSAAVHDFDGDGNLDLAVANSGQNTVTLLPGIEEGEFSAVVTTTDVGDTPVALEQIDADGVGETNDIVVVNSVDGDVSILINSNGFFFAPRIDYPVGGSPSAVIVADFNDDGNDDFAVANGGSASVSVYTNLGDGSGDFALADTIAVGPTPASIAAGAVFTFASNDLVVANSGNDTVAVLQNAGDGTFSLFGSFATGDKPTSIVMGTFNSDEFDDLAVTCMDGGEVRSYAGDGAGTFSAESITFIGQNRGPNFLAVGHFNSTFPVPDANEDLVIANQLVDSASVLLGAAIDNSFSLQFTLDTGPTPVWIEVADLNGDGLDDLVIVTRDNDNAATFIGQGDSTFIPSAVYDTSDRIVDRRFNPGAIHVLPPDFGKPDFDILYNNDTGGAGPWLTDDIEYNAWNFGTNSILRTLFPDTRRCTHPFFWDGDGDRMPDGWELAFQYDPWDRNTDDDEFQDWEENPDGDWYAQSNATIFHNDVYLTNDYNPATAFGYIDTEEVGPNTFKFNNFEELIGPRRIPAIIENDPNDTATHPFRHDTEGDGMWDGWEWYVGLNPRDPNDAGDDDCCDDDDLINLDEFRSYATSTNIEAALTPLPEWANKLLPTDPFDGDTDFDQVGDNEEREIFNLGVVSNVTDFQEKLIENKEINHFFYLGGGLNPTTVDTDDDYLPDAWETYWPGELLEDGSVEGGMDGTIADAYEDSDGDGLVNYQEYMTGAIYMWAFQYNNGDTAWTPGRGIYGYEPYDFFDVTQSAGGDWATGPGGRGAKAWDANFWVDPDIVPYRFMTAAEGAICGFRFSSTDPGDTDSDLDGMDDFWEAYHGLNPLFGVVDLVLSKQPCLEKGVFWVALVPDPLDPDIRKYPWISGEPFLDIDQDEIININESVVPDAAVPPPYHHTDPSPHWVTDHSSQDSFVNLYYWLGDILGTGDWFWSYPFFPPTWLFSFEINEGFDTDNDTRPDAAELVHTPSVSPGVTDPQNSESPIKRRALYLNGNAAVRTRHDYFQDAQDLRTFTVECWARSEMPQSGGEQILVDRTMRVPQGNLLDATAGLRSNFQLGIDQDGVPFVRYHGGSKDLLFVEAIASPVAAVQSNQWCHIAATYGGDVHSNGLWVGQLKLYVDGELVALAPSSEIPANGWFGQLITTGSGEDPVTNVGFILAAPIVVGAADTNPVGWIDNEAVWVGPLAGLNPELAFGPPMLDKQFYGWVDEVRIWDGARGQADIREDMTESYTRLRAGEEGMIESTNVTFIIVSNALVPIVVPRLLYAYGFDDLPDPDHNPVAPDGFDFLNMRPPSYINVPWWGQSSMRSTEYDDYRYVPWIENKVNHAPRNPPRDTFIEQSVSNNVYANTADPFGFAYYHEALFRFERNPYETSIGQTGDAEQSEYNDAIPLLDAVTDEDVAMWDGGGIPAVDPFDTDGDSLPDSWEETFGLDPLNPDGVHGAFGDLDGDGLSNLAEYLAGTLPNTGDSDGDGVVDYFSRSGPGELMFGEIFDDGDGLPGTWELLFPGPALNTGQPGLDEFAYDAHLDPDADGWSNLGEYLGAGTLAVDANNNIVFLTPTSTDPLSVNSFPLPTLNLILTANGTLPAGSTTIIEFYTEERMDGSPVAVLNIPDDVFAVTTSVMDEGHLHEGKHWVIAYNDANGNGVLDEDEYAGIPKERPVIVGAGADVLLEIHMTQNLPGYGRFSWTGASPLSNTTIRINNLSVSGAPLVIEREVRGPRSYFHEGDHWFEGLFGLDTGSYVVNPMIGGVVDSANRHFFTVVWNTPDTPIPISPRGATFEFLENEFVFALDPEDSASFDLQISNTVSGELMMDTNFAVHYISQNFVGASNIYRCTLRFYPDEWSNGLYCWRARSRNPGVPGSSQFTSSFSAWESFTLNIEDGGPAASTIKGEVLYFGRVSGGNTNGVVHTDLPIIVEAHRRATFSGIPDGRDSFIGTVGPTDLPGEQGDYALLGLRQGEYFIVAYIDSNGNRQLDPFEPLGFSKNVLFSSDYRPRLITIADVTGEVIDNVKIVVFDRDTDDDDLPDGWEWQYLATFGFDGADDPNGDNVSLLTEYKTGVDPNVLDTDEDGLTDEFEILVGSNPARADSDEDSDGVPSVLEIGWDNNNGYDPFDANSHGPEGTDLDIHNPDTDADGVDDLLEIAGGSDPLDDEDTGSVYIKRVSVDSAGNPVLEWDFHPNARSMNVTCKVMCSSDLAEWTAAPGGTEVMDGDSAGSTAYTNTAASRCFFRLDLSVELDEQ